MPASLSDAIEGMTGAQQITYLRSLLAIKGEELADCERCGSQVKLKDMELHTARAHGHANTPGQGDGLVNCERYGAPLKFKNMKRHLDRVHGPHEACLAKGQAGRLGRDKKSTRRPHGRPRVGSYCMCSVCNSYIEDSETPRPSFYHAV
jgi:uncharacterized C2H2 Zn-finger protein